LAATLANGALKYRTAWAFCKAKGKNNWERELILEIIGSKPDAVHGRNRNKRRAPWLGDWQKRRANGFWAFDDEAKMRSINQMIKERTNAQEAARALAPLTAKQIARWGRLAEKIDEALAGEPFLRNEALTSPRNRLRFKIYVRMHKQVFEQEIIAWECWMTAVHR
jgi:hypothetical protein